MARKLTKLEKHKRKMEYYEAKIKKLDEEYTQFLAQPPVVEVYPLPVTSQTYTDNYNRILSAVGRGKQPETVKETQTIDNNDVKPSTSKVSSKSSKGRISDTQPKKKKALIYYADRKKQNVEQPPVDPAFRAMQLANQKRLNEEFEEEKRQKRLLAKSEKLKASAKPSSIKVSATQSREDNYDKPSTSKVSAKSSKTIVSGTKVHETMSAEVAKIIKAAQPKKKQASAKPSSTTQSREENKRSQSPARKRSATRDDAPEIISSEQQALMRRFENKKIGDVRPDEKEMFKMFQQIKSQAKKTSAPTSKTKISATSSRNSLGSAKPSTTNTATSKDTAMMSAAEVAKIIKDAQPKKKKPLIYYADRKKQNIVQPPVDPAFRAQQLANQKRLNEEFEEEKRQKRLLTKAKSSSTQVTATKSKEDNKRLQLPARKPSSTRDNPPEILSSEQQWLIKRFENKKIGEVRPDEMEMFKIYQKIKPRDTKTFATTSKAQLTASTNSLIAAIPTKTKTATLQAIVAKPKVVEPVLTDEQRKHKEEQEILRDYAPIVYETMQRNKEATRKIAELKQRVALKLSSLGQSTSNL